MRLHFLFFLKFLIVTILNLNLLELPPPNLCINAINTSLIPRRSPKVSSKSNKARTAPIGSSNNPSAFKTSERGEVNFICSTNGETTVGPVARTMALYIPATCHERHLNMLLYQF